MRRKQGTPSPLTTNIQQAILSKTDIAAVATDEFRPDRNVRDKVEEIVEGLRKEDATRIRISTVSAKLISEIAVVTITSPDIMLEENGGVNDRRMGVTSHSDYCRHCRQIDCPGHYGQIILNEPVINPAYIKMVVAVLNCVCIGCGTLLFKSWIETDPGIRRLSGWPRILAIAKKSKGGICNSENLKPLRGQDERPSDRPIYTCGGSKNPVVSLPKGRKKGTTEAKNYLTIKRDHGEPAPISAAKAYEVLNRISDEDARLLGYNTPDSHPRDMILLRLAVIPPSARPSEIIDNKIEKDDLTSQYQKIVKANNEINDGTVRFFKKTKKPKTKQDMANALYDRISELIYGKLSEKRVNYDTFVSIFQRINGKDALVRGAMMGKRTDYSARGVFSPGGDLEFGEVGVPERVARDFHMPVRVTQDNLDWIISLLRAGRLVYHTAHRGEMKNRKMEIRTGARVTIEVGDEVERMLQDGDLVAANRQPSLHKYSYMAYSVKIVDTFRMHPSATTPHNMDFDGDAANILFHRDPKSIRELRELMHITKNMINDAQNKPVVGLILDSIIGAYLLTSYTENVDPFTFTDVFNRMKKDNRITITSLQSRAVKYGLSPYSGRTLFSALFPEDFYYKQAGVLVIDGILIAGRITSSHVGVKHRSIIQDILVQYGSERAARFITDATWLLTAWLQTFGFSVGPADCDYGRLQKEIKEQELKKIYAELMELGPRPDDKIRRRNYESRVQAVLSKVNIFGRNLGKQAMGECTMIKGRQNAMGIMSSDTGAGAKADPANLCQMGGFIGPQFFQGARLCATLNKGSRCLVTQPCRDPESDIEPPPQERGFCESSFWEGTTPEEMFYLLQAGREGLMNTSKSTSEVGRTRRDIAKALENIIIWDDLTIRNQRDETNIKKFEPQTIYAFSYGGDGLYSGELLNVNTPSQGTVPTFCDVDMIVNKLNSSVGWIREDLFTAIQNNETKFQQMELQQLEVPARGEPPVPISYDYGTPVRVETSIRSPVPSSGPIPQITGEVPILLPTPL